MDTFSANSLKILDKDSENFRLKYKEGLFLNPDNSNTKAGQNLHNFLCFYLKGFDMTKIEASFSKKDRDFIDKIKEFDAIKTLKAADDGPLSGVVKNIEQPFLIKCGGNKLCSAANSTQSKAEEEFYLTGRFDAILQTEKGVQIYDWKMVNLPKDAESDIQTVVYLYAASKLYKTENVSITYVSLTKNESKTVSFDPEFNYLSRISGIVKKA